MKKQQKKRADSQMVVANRDARQRKHKSVRSDETPLLINQSLSNASLSGGCHHHSCSFVQVQNVKLSPVS